MDPALDSKEPTREILSYIDTSNLPPSLPVMSDATVDLFSKVPHTASKSTTRPISDIVREESAHHLAHPTQVTILDHPISRSAPSNVSKPESSQFMITQVPNAAQLEALSTQPPEVSEWTAFPPAAQRQEHAPAAMTSDVDLGLVSAPATQDQPSLPSSSQQQGKSPANIASGSTPVLGIHTQPPLSEPQDSPDLVSSVRASSPVAHAPRAPGLVRQASISQFPTLGTFPPLQHKKSLGTSLAHPTRTPGAPAAQGIGGKRTSWLKRARENKPSDSSVATLSKRTSGAVGSATGAKRKSGEITAAPGPSNEITDKAELQRRRSKFAKFILDGDVTDVRVDVDEERKTYKAFEPDATLPFQMPAVSHPDSAPTSTQNPQLHDFTIATKNGEDTDATRPAEDDYMTTDFTIATKLDDRYLTRQDYTTTNFGDHTTRSELQDFTTSNFTTQTRNQDDDIWGSLKQTMARLKSTGSGKSLGGAALAEAKKAAEARVIERRKEEGKPIDRSMVDHPPSDELSAAHVLDSQHPSIPSQDNISETSKRLSLSDLAGPSTTKDFPVIPSDTIAQPASRISTESSLREHVREANKSTTPARSPPPQKLVPSLALPSGPVFSKPLPPPGSSRAPSPTRPLGGKEFSFKSFATTVFSVPVGAGNSSSGEPNKAAPLTANPTEDSILSQPQEIFDVTDSKQSWVPSTQDTEYSLQPPQSESPFIEKEASIVDDGDDSLEDEGGYTGGWAPPGFNKSTTSTWSTARTTSQKGEDADSLDSDGRPPVADFSASHTVPPSPGRSLPSAFVEYLEAGDAIYSEREEEDPGMDVQPDDAEELLHYGKSTVNLVQVGLFRFIS
jgi:hypothetical protein